MPAKKKHGQTTTKKKNGKAINPAETRKMRSKGKKVNAGINPATKLPHTKSYLRGL